VYLVKNIDRQKVDVKHILNKWGNNEWIIRNYRSD
jgi:hypothetical protein